MRRLYEDVDGPLRQAQQAATGAAGGDATGGSLDSSNPFAALFGGAAAQNPGKPHLAHAPGALSGGGLVDSIRPPRLPQGTPTTTRCPTRGGVLPAALGPLPRLPAIRSRACLAAAVLEAVRTRWPR